MAINRAKKEEVVEKLKKALKNAKSLVFVNFHGLSVTNATLMRRTLKKENVSYMVAKKTLTNRALEGIKLKGTRPPLEGELALAWGEDLMAPAREVYAFGQKFPESLSIMGGVFDGRFMTKEEMKEIALIPTMKVLRGKFVNIINSPIQRFAVVLNEVVKIRN